MKNYQPPPHLKTIGKQEFRRTDFGSRLLAAEGEEGKGQRTGVGEDEECVGSKAISFW
jgi:hypothetical protein